MSSNDDDQEDEQTQEKKLVGVRISEERRDEWKNFVERSNEYGSMAQMMRAGVEQIMSETSDTDQLVQDLETEIQDLRTEVERTRTSVEDLPMRIDDAEETAEEVIYKLRDSDVTGDS